MLVRHILTLDLPVETPPRQAELIKRGLRSSESKADDPLNADVGECGHAAAGHQSQAPIRLHIRAYDMANYPETRRPI